LIVLAAVLSSLVTAVLYAVWHFNRHIPGLRYWVFSFLSAAVFCCNLLVRGPVPEVVSVVLAQVAIALTGYLCWLGSRAYMGRAPIPRGYAALALAGLVGASVYFTDVQPNPGARFVMAGLFSGVFFLLTAHTLVRGGFHRVPMRYLFGGMLCAHGIFVLMRPLAFKLLALQGDSSLPSSLSSIVVLESIVTLVLIGFGTVMLINEFITNELRHLAEVDPLTSVFNRRAFLTLLDKALSNAQRVRKPLPVLVLDLDHFKQVNDTRGHQGGDAVLRHFVNVAQQCLRNEDVMGRIGGEEFAIFLPNADGVGALAVAERLRALLEASPCAADSARPIAITVSVGVALTQGVEAPETVLQRADEAMYLAKQRGRNRVEMVSSAPCAPHRPAGDVAPASLPLSASH
jgi:diguanylate cyclase (GGDEF)-like protein